MKKERIIPNPFIGINLSPKEIKYIKKYATDYGVSEAQIARGLLRSGVQRLALLTTDPDNYPRYALDVVKLGAL